MANVAVAHHEQDDKATWITLALLIGLLIVGYGNSLIETAKFWMSPNGKYAHGWLIPGFTLYLLWVRRESVGEVPANDRWWGVLMLSGALALRLLATYFPNLTPEMYSFVPAVAGIFLMVGGWNMMRWAGAPIAFLILMYPLPSFADTLLLQSLQKFATYASNYTLQTLGVACHAEGNTIFVSETETPMGVVEQCSGLRMLTIFVALCVAMGFLTNRPIWERIVVAISSVPIAVASNVFRITLTGLAHLVVSPETAGKLGHDMAEIGRAHV